MVMNHFHLWDDPMGCERLFEDQQQLLSPGQSDVLRHGRHGHGFTGKKIQPWIDPANMGDFAPI